MAKHGLFCVVSFVVFVVSFVSLHESQANILVSEALHSPVHSLHSLHSPVHSLHSHLHSLTLIFSLSLSLSPNSPNSLHSHMTFLSPLLKGRNSLVEFHHIILCYDAIVLSGSF